MNRKMNILFYDGSCGFCNKSVQFVLNNETDSSIHFAALQSEFTRIFFEEKNLTQPDFNTFYFWDGMILYERSNAALEVVSHLKWYWRWMRFFRVIPKTLRDGVYDFIAKRRHRISANFCAIPNIEQQVRFLK